MSQFKTICREVIRHRFRLVTADVKVTRPAEGGSCVAKRIEISMEWQPIETAPRDGTRILLYRPLADRTNDDPIDIKRGVPRDNGCWGETIPAGLSGENYTDGACRATHWMPLPEAPNV